MRECPRCYGGGKLAAWHDHCTPVLEPCRWCGGTGFTNHGETIMSFPQTINFTALGVLEDRFRGQGQHSNRETAEAAYDVCGWIGYLTFGGPAGPAPAAAPAGHGERHSDLEVANVLKAMREAHQAAPQGTQHALGDRLPGWLKAALLKLLTDLLTGALAGAAG